MDFNIIVDFCGVKTADISETIKKAFELGYRTIALNTVLSSDSLQGKGITVPEPLKIPVREVLGDSEIKILHRITAIIKDAIHCHHLLQNPNTKKYDIIAVQPTDEKLLQHVCGIGDIEIISIDFSEKLAFSPKRTYFGQAVERGIMFEIQYAQCLRDQTARRNVIANSQVVVDVLKGKHLIISSGAEKAIELRGVHDIVNLAALFGFSPDKGRAAVFSNGQKVLSHSFTRRKTGCGFVAVQEIAKTDPWIVSLCAVPRKSA